MVRHCMLQGMVDYSNTQSHSKVSMIMNQTCMQIAHVYSVALVSIEKCVIVGLLITIATCIYPRLQANFHQLLISYLCVNEFLL